MNKIGICIPVYNNERYLSEAIQSTLIQEEQADEVLVLVHDSVDNSLGIAESFFPQVRVIVENNNLSIGAAWNKVCQYSDCNYIIILHADDRLTSNAVKTLKNLIAQDSEIGLIFARAKLISAQGTFLGIDHEINEVNLTGEEYLEKLMQGFLPKCSGICVRRNLILQEKFREDLNILLDVEFFLRSGWSTKVVGIADFLAEYRIYPESTGLSDTSRKSSQDEIKWWASFEAGEIKMPSNLVEKYRSYLFKRIITAFLRDLWNGDHINAREWLDFIKIFLQKYPHLYASSFSRRSRIIYTLAQSSWLGYQLAYRLVLLREKFRILLLRFQEKLYIEPSHQ